MKIWSSKKLTKKTMAKEVISFTLLIGILYFISKPLPPEAQQWLAEFRQPDPIGTQAYYFLSGIYAPDGVDPIAYGVLLYEEDRQIKALLQTNPGKFPQASQAAAETRRATSMENEPTAIDDLNCSPNEEDCVAHYRAHKADIDSLLEKNTILLERMQRFLEYKTYKSPCCEADPDYDRGREVSHLKTAMLIDTLRLWRLLAEGKVDMALAQWHKNFNGLRHAFTEVDSLLGKIMLMTTLNKQLDALLAIHRYSPQTPIPMIQPLSNAERSYHKIAVSELWYAHQNRSFFAPEAKDWIAVLMSIPRQVITKTMISGQFRALRTLEELSAGSPSEAARLMAQWHKPGRSPGFLDWPDSFLERIKFMLRLGNAWMAIIRDSESNSFIRGFDIDAKIKLTNALLLTDPDFWLSASAVQNHADAINDLRNPYYPDRSARHDLAMGKLCFDRPNTDPARDLCVATRESTPPTN